MRIQILKCIFIYTILKCYYQYIHHPVYRDTLSINIHTCPLRQPVIIITPPSSRARCFDWYPLLSFPTTFPTPLPPPQLLSRSLSKYYFSIWLDICEWKWMLSRPPHIPFAQRDTGCQEHLFLRLILLTYNLRHTCSMMPSPLLLDLFINIFFLDFLGLVWAFIFWPPQNIVLQISTGSFLPPWQHTPRPRSTTTLIQSG